MEYIEIKKSKRSKKRSSRIFVVLLALILALICSMAVLNLFNRIWDSVPASTAEEYITEDPYRDVALHSYDWDKLSYEDGRFHYSGAGLFSSKALQGVDVSRYQGDIDWQAVKNDGIDYAIIRVGYRGYETGKINIDEKFSRNLQGALSSSLDAGLYFFSQAITEEEAVEEAEFVLSQISGSQITYPIVFDLEEINDATHRTYNLSSQERTDIALAFCQRIKDAGFTPMIYGNPSWLTDSYDLSQICSYDLWLAQYSDIPGFKYEFAMWQYTNNGTVDGIDHAVDLNLCFKSY